jgi:hypothetical protein
MLTLRAKWFLYDGSPSDKNRKAFMFDVLGLPEGKRWRLASIAASGGLAVVGASGPTKDSAPPNKPSPALRFKRWCPNLACGMGRLKRS